jgi:hypothetical protein
VINTPKSAAQALKRYHTSSPAVADAVTVTDGAVTVGFITERGAKHCAFDAAGTLIGEYRTRVDAVRAIPNLLKQASAILKRARCDTITAAKKDRAYRRSKRAESQRLGRHWRARKKKLGKFGAASPVRIIPAGS